MNTYFTADPHVSHQRILELTQRGKKFSSIQEHDEYIVARINERVGSEDQLYIIGDVGKKRDVNWLLDNLKVRDVRLAPGNHDENECSMQFLRHSFKVVEHILEHKFKDKNGVGHRMVMCHYPFLVFNQSFRGGYMLHGHVHRNLNPYYKQFLPHARTLDVGIDSAFEFLGDYVPFSEQEVIDILSKRRGHSPDVNRFIVQDVLTNKHDGCIDILFDYNLNTDYLPIRGDMVYCDGNEYEVHDINTDKLIMTLLDVFGDCDIEVGDELIWF